MINLRAVRATGSKPRVHGNGFIQLDLTERTRLHVWGDPRIPKQKVSTPIHDHIFGFKSTIIVGRLVNVVYMVESRDPGDYIVYASEVRVGEDTILKPTDVQVIIEPSHTDIITWRSSSLNYNIQPFTFHESIAPDGPTATVIVKDGPTQAQVNALGTARPRILVPVGSVPDNDFTRYDADEDLLWRIIEQTLGRRSV